MARCGRRHARLSPPSPPLTTGAPPRRPQVTISNDGATLMKKLQVVHPAANTLVQISMSQDAEVGDGTTSVVLLAGEFLREAKPYIEEGVHPQVIIKAYRQAVALATAKIDSLAVNLEQSGGEVRAMLEKSAATSLSSKLVSGHKQFFAKMVVDAVLSLDQAQGLDMLGTKKVVGGSLQDSMLVEGVAFKKTFSYAGFEQMTKHFKAPKIVLLNVELELKAERDNAEVRVSDVTAYQAVVDAEWGAARLPPSPAPLACPPRLPCARRTSRPSRPSRPSRADIIYDKLAKIVASGANIVLSKLAIGDLATQYFADRGLFCAGRVEDGDLKRVAKATGAAVQTSCNDLSPGVLGACGEFEERQVGGERFNFFSGCDKAQQPRLRCRPSRSCRPASAAEPPRPLAAGEHLHLHPAGRRGAVHRGGGAIAARRDHEHAPAAPPPVRHRRRRSHRDGALRLLARRVAQDLRRAEI